MSSNIRSFRPKFQPQSAEPTFAVTACGLTFALDKANGHRAGHTLRSCLLGMRIGRRAGLQPSEFRSLYYALLFKDIGTTGEQECGKSFLQEAGPEARLLWNDGPSVLPRRRAVVAMLGLLRQHASLGGFKDLLEKLLAGRLQRESIRRRRRLLGFQRITEMGLSRDTAEAVGYVDSQWDGSGTPALRKGSIPLLAQIVKLAQIMELLYGVYGSAKTMSIVYRRCKGWFDPGLVAAAMLTFHSEETWQILEQGDLASMVAAMEPAAENGKDEGSLERLCLVFADVIDTRSQHMLRHSTSVATLAAQIGQHMGLGDQQMMTLRYAALLHDLGNLGVDPDLLDKPDALTDADRESVSRAPLMALDFLSSVPGFEEVASTAAMHRERLDGSGQPFGLRGESITTLARILAVADVTEALAAGRSYRSKHAPEEVMEILLEMTPNKLDHECVMALHERGALAMVS